MLISHLRLLFSSWAHSVHWTFRLFWLPRDTKKKISRSLSYFSPISTGLPLVRLGNEGDGGYLLPNDFEGITALFSPGVSDETSFEMNLSRQQIDCFLADASIDEPVFPRSNIHFDRLWLVAFPESQDEITLEAWVNQYRPDGDLVLQMDIEGSEYEVLLTTPEKMMQRFRIIVVELHGLHQVFTEPGQKILSALGKKLSQTHSVAHIHTNNLCRVVRTGEHTIPNCLEVTLIRKDRVRGSGPRPQIPHPLDVSHSRFLPQGVPRW